MNEARWASRADLQERFDCPQKISEGYRFGDVGVTSALQAFPLILGAGERGYRNDWNGLGPLILFKQTGHFEPADVRQSNIHQDQIWLFLTGEVERLKTLGGSQYFVAVCL